MDDYSALELEDKEVIAVFDARVHSALSNLLHSSQIRVDGVVSEDEWKSKVEARSSLRLKNAKRLSMKTSVLLTGPKFASEEVARTLSSYQLYLQDVYSGLTTCQYSNPQSLEIPKMPVIEDVLLNLEPFDCLGDELGSDHSPATQSLEGDDLLDLAGFFDEFTSHDFLPKASTDVRIKTSLLRYCIRSSTVSLSDLTVS